MSGRSAAGFHERAASQVERLRASGAADGKALLLVGRPGAGKTLWARQWAKTNRAWRERESDVSAIRRIAGLDDLKTHEMGVGEMATGGPFRAPHHTVSDAGLCGTLTRGFIVRPGEASLAHGGTLFLDEVLEFRRGALGMLLSFRKAGFVRLFGSSALSGERHCQVVVPAEFSLVMASNPCACGYAGVDETQRGCHCPRSALERYRERLSELAEASGALVLVSDGRGGFEPGSAW